MPRTPADHLQGTVDILVLRTLAWQPMHGYGISRWIRDRTEGVLSLENAALYPALHRLERRRLITSRWGLTDTNRRAKFYELSEEGRRQLSAEAASWQAYVAAVHKVLSPA